MGKRIYLLLRELHLYLGLFVAPFVLLFAISIFFLVHSWIPGVPQEPGAPRTISNIPIAENLTALDGRARVDAVSAMLKAIGITGEISFITYVPARHRMLVPVSVPGRKTTVEIDLERRTAVVRQHITGIWDALITLHKAPGPHLAFIRMNWWPMRVWRWFADGTVYLLLLISVSGIYMWWMLRSERRAGLACLAAGLLSFSGIIYVLCR